MSGRTRPQTAHISRRREGGEGGEGGGLLTSPLPLGGTGGVPPRQGAGVQRPQSALSRPGRQRPSSAPVNDRLAPKRGDGTMAATPELVTQGSYFAKMVQKSSRPASAVSTRPGSARPTSARSSILKEEESVDPKAWHRFYLQDPGGVEGRPPSFYHFDVYNSWEDQFKEAKDFSIWKFSRHFYSQGHEQATGQIRNFASRPAGAQEVEELSRYVEAMVPRTVHDVKPLLVLAQGLLRDLIGGKHQLYLRALDKERERGKAFEHGLQGEVAAVLSAANNAYGDEIRVLRDALEALSEKIPDANLVRDIDAAMTSADAAAMERKVRYGDPDVLVKEACERLEEAHRKRLKEEEDEKAAAAKPKVEEGDGKKRKSARPPSGRPSSVRGERAPVPERPLPPMTSGGPPTPGEGATLEEKRKALKEQEMADLKDILASTQAALASLQKDRDGLNIHLQQAVQELAANSALVRRQEAELDRLRVAVSRGSPAGSPEPGEPSLFAPRPVTEGPFARVLERAGPAPSARRAHLGAAQACQLLSDVTGGLAAYVGMLVPPAAPASTSGYTGPGDDPWETHSIDSGYGAMGLEYVAADTETSWLVGRILEPGSGVTLDAIARDRVISIRDVSRDPRIFWWRSRDDPPRIAQNGGAGEGFSSARRSGALMVIPLYREGDDGRKPAGVLVVDTVGRTRKALSRDDVAAAEGCAAAIGELIARQADAMRSRADSSDRRIRSLQASADSAAAAPTGKDLVREWMTTVDEMLDLREERHRVEIQALEPAMESKLFEMSRLVAPAPAAVHILCATLLAIRPEKLPLDQSLLPIPDSQIAAVWPTLQRALAIRGRNGEASIQGGLRTLSVAQVLIAEKAAHAVALNQWSGLTEKPVIGDGSRFVAVRQVLRKVSVEEALRAGAPVALLRTWLSAMLGLYCLQMRMEQIMEIGRERGDTACKLWEEPGAPPAPEGDLPPHVQELIDQANHNTMLANQQANPLLKRRPGAEERARMSASGGEW